MLSEEITELELENIKLKKLLKQAQEDIPKPKKCESCKYYIRHYGRTVTGIYFKLYTGHCICEVPIKHRKEKNNPMSDDTCICFKRL